MEYFYFKGDDLWSSADHELTELASSEIERVGLARQADVVDARVVRSKQKVGSHADAKA